MKDTDYNQTSKESECGDALDLPGEHIDHVKNRYALNCTLTNHAKRANRHMWEITLTIKNESKELPIFRNIKISERRNTVIRDGVALEHERKRSQIICDGELILSERVSPFVLDLILDISYVSTTKCENVDIKIKRSRKAGEHDVLDCQLFMH